MMGLSENDKRSLSHIARLLWCCLLASMLFMVCPSMALAAHLQPAQVDSLLKIYDQAEEPQRGTLARQLVEGCLADDPLSNEQLKVDDNLPLDSINLSVWYAAERYYFNHSYFAEAIELIDRALPLTLYCQLEMRCKLLCDRGYCLFKTGQNTEAVEAEMEAERLAREYGWLQQQARAFNYLAIINLSLGNTDEAKHFVKRALQADRATGSDLNTHNYLGIACEVYNVAKVPDSAVMYGRQAVEAARKIGYREGVVNHLSQLSYAYNRMGDYVEGLKLAREAVSLVEQMPVVDRNLLAISLEYVAYNLLDMKRNAEAVPIVRRAIALQQEVGNTRSVCYDYYSLAEALEPDSPRVAMVALRQYSRMMDSIHYAQMHEVLGKANAQLHNDELAETNAMTQRQNRIILISSIIVILLLVAASAALWYAMRQRGRTNCMLERLQTMREQFFSHVAHEFRTPLTVIIGLSRQMQDKQPATPPRQAAHMIEQQGSQLLELVNQLLDLTKLQLAPQLKPEQVRQDVVGQIEMIVECFRALAQQKDVTLTYEPAERQVVMEYASDYMNKILSNLLSNAVKFTDSGGSVRVKTRVVGDRFCLSVSDTGCGIPASKVDKIFDPFYQVKNSDRRQSGTGIGLSLVRQLVDAVGATISVDSKEGVGTQFTINFQYQPKSQAEEQPAAPTASTRTLAAVSVADEPELCDADTDDDTRTRILVVDDNSAVAYYIGTILSPRFDVFYAADGQLALEKACQIVPDLVVTDLMMPRIDGLELCRRLRADELTSHIPVIVITAKAGDNDRLEGLEAGADAYLTKPFNAEELTIRVVKLLEQRRALRAKFSQQMLEGASPEEAEDDDADSTMEMSKLDENFLKKVDGFIVELMPKGEADVEHLAAQFFMHPSTFRRKMMAITGMPPAQYIMRLRMEQACVMLLDYPTVTIADVAERLGFSDNAHFSHAFRRYYHTTPLQWARNKENKEE